MTKIIYTLGHSNRKVEEFKNIINKYNIEVVVDIRRWPKSRKNPQYSREYLEEYLKNLGLKYIWMGDVLGGYIRCEAEVPLRCFKSEGFCLYAYYILTNKDARKALERIVDLAKSNTVLVLCAERLPWRCHRKIVSDWLLWRGFRIIHIIDLEHVVEHHFTKCVRIVDGQLVYL